MAPSSASPACAGAPSTRTWNHSTPTCAFQIAARVGSVRIAASAVCPASTQASAPLPVHSSSTTDCSWTFARGVEAEALQAAHGADHRREPRLHVAGAAAVHPLAVDARVVGVAGPQRGRLGADDVDVAVEDQRAAVGGAGRRASPRARSPCRRRPSRTARRPGWRSSAAAVERHVERLEPERRERAAHDGLARAPRRPAASAPRRAPPAARSSRAPRPRRPPGSPRPRARPYRPRPGLRGRRGSRSAGSSTR